MWGEGASDLWGRLEEEEGERVVELPQAVQVDLPRTTTKDLEEPMPVDVEAA